jgi:hypothetical protein
VQERHVLRVGRRDLKVFVGIGHQRVPVERARHVRGLPLFAHEDQVIETGQLVTDPRDLAPVQAFGRDQHPAVADAESRLDRLGTEGGEQLAEHAEVLERAERGHIELGGAPHQREHPIAFGDPEASQDVGKSIGLLAERVVAEVPDGAVLADPAERQVTGKGPGGVAVDRLVRDIEPPPVRQALEHQSGGIPSEMMASAIVVGEVRTEPQLSLHFHDRRICVLGTQCTWRRRHAGCLPG